MTQVKPVWPWYLIKPDGVAPQAGGIYLSNVTSFGDTATVVGVPCPCEDGQPITVGCRVIYDRQASRGAGVDNKEYQLVKIDDIRGVIIEQVQLGDGN